MCHRWRSLRNTSKDGIATYSPLARRQEAEAKGTRQAARLVVESCAYKRRVEQDGWPSACGVAGLSLLPRIGEGGFAQ